MPRVGMSFFGAGLNPRLQAEGAIGFRPMHPASFFYDPRMPRVGRDATQVTSNRHFNDAR